MSPQFQKLFEILMIQAFSFNKISIGLEIFKTNIPRESSLLIVVQFSNI